MAERFRKVRESSELISSPFSSKTVNKERFDEALGQVIRRRRTALRRLGEARDQSSRRG